MYKDLQPNKHLIPPTLSHLTNRRTRNHVQVHWIFQFSHSLLCCCMFITRKIAHALALNRVDICRMCVLCVEKNNSFCVYFNLLQTSKFHAMSRSVLKGSNTSHIYFIFWNCKNKTKIDFFQPGYYYVSATWLDKCVILYNCVVPFGSSFFLVFAICKDTHRMTVRCALVSVVLVFV